MAAEKVSKRSLLLELPPELRNRVYHEALVSDQFIMVMIEASNKNDEWTMPALLQTCTQIRNEASGMYFANDVFQIRAPYPSRLQDSEVTRSVMKWFRAFGPSRCCMLRHVIFEPQWFESLEEAQRCMLTYRGLLKANGLIAEKCKFTAEFWDFVEGPMWCDEQGTTVALAYPPGLESR